MTTETTSDGEVWARLIGGEAELFAVIYDRHADAIYGYCFRRTGSWTAAQDLTSIVFLEAWRRRADIRINAEGSLRPWLFGVASNVVRNRSRAARRHRSALRRLPPALVAGDPFDDVDSRLDDEARMRQVLSVFGRLAPAHQEVLALTAWAGLDTAAVAVALGVPVGTVKSRLNRARAALAALESSAGSNAPLGAAPSEGETR